MEYLHKILPIIIYVLIMAIHYALSRTGIKLFRICSTCDCYGWINLYL